MYTVVSWLDDRGTTYVYVCMCMCVRVCVWLVPHAQLPLNHASDSPVYWLETDTFKGFIHATLSEVNSIAQASWAGHSPSCPGWFLHVGCLPLTVYPFTEAVLFPSALLHRLISDNTSSSGRYRFPEGRWSWFYFIQCEFYVLLIGAEIYTGVYIQYLLGPDVWLHITGAPLNLNSWKVRCF